MMVLPWVGGVVNAWRLEPEEFADEWDSGAGAAHAGGRWNPVGYPAVYCAAARTA
jgi:RES domain-containing protein